MLLWEERSTMTLLKEVYTSTFGINLNLLLDFFFVYGAYFYEVVLEMSDRNKSSARAIMLYLEMIKLT